MILLTVRQLGRLNHALRREVALIFGDGTIPPSCRSRSYPRESS